MITYFLVTFDGWYLKVTIICRYIFLQFWLKTRFADFGLMFWNVLLPSDGLS